MFNSLDILIKTFESFYCGRLTNNVETDPIR